MTLSKLSYALTLIALGLLLNAESLASTTSENHGEKRNPSDSHGPPPAPGVNTHPEKSHTAESKNDRKKDNRGTKEQPLVVEVLTSPSASQPAEKEPEKSNTHPLEDKSVEKWSAGINAVSAFVVAAFTGCLWWVSTKQWKATRDAAEAALEEATAVKLAERAYLKMSHSPPGLRIPTDPLSLPWVNMEVKNIGNTPARVTAVILWRMILRETDPLPVVPPYPEPEVVDELFLYRDDPFYFTKRFAVEQGEREQIDRGDKIFYVYGYVDYIDQFGQRHRAGYARRFGIQETSTSDNLLFVTQPGYNYDRKRQPNEGRD